MRGSNSSEAHPMAGSASSAPIDAAFKQSIKVVAVAVVVVVPPALLLLLLPLGCFVGLQLVTVEWRESESLEWLGAR